MAEIKHTVRCAICGKKETITIADTKIPEDWFYFGKLDVTACKTSKYFLEPKDQSHPFDNLIKVPNPCYDPKAKHIFVEYWECKKCNEKGEEEGENVRKIKTIKELRREVEKCYKKCDKKLTSEELKFLDGVWAFLYSSKMSNEDHDKLEEIIGKIKRLNAILEGGDEAMRRRGAEG